MKPQNVVVDFSPIFATYGPGAITAPVAYSICPNLNLLVLKHSLRFILEAAYLYGRETLLQRDALWELIDDYQREDPDWLTVCLYPETTFGDRTDDYDVLDLFYNIVIEESDLYLQRKLKEVNIDDVGNFTFKKWVTPTAMILGETTYI